ncbi:hypothetical protein MBLNU459_g2929t1 [Dothideomycetes sp. NU459]
MSGKDAALYGIPRPTKKSSGKEISSSTTLSFTSQLSSLISSAGTSHSTGSRSRKVGKKEDIFSTHNRNAKKRALKDLEPDGSAFDQKHSTSSESIDASAWHRSKRKMEEKARLYAAMKRGDVEDTDEKHMVDFDQKWADAQAKGDMSDESSDQESESDQEMIEWTDEFGRTRSGTRSQMLREQRSEQLAEASSHRARPAMPSTIIYGDTVQAAAFNPDEPVVQQMAELAAKRDKSATPPPETHFDSSKEIRSKGVGFMQFSQDPEERKRQMDGLEKDRLETEKRRDDREQRLRQRKHEVERRRREIMERRGKRQADDFLQDLGAELSVDKKDGDTSVDTPDDGMQV